MRNILKRIDNFYNNHKWFRIVFTIFEYVVMFVIGFLSLIGLMLLIKKPVIYSNDYDLSNNISQIDYTLGSITYVSYETDVIENENLISIRGEYYIIDWMDYKTAWVGSNKMVLSLPKNDYIRIEGFDYYDVDLIEIQGNSIYLISNGLLIDKLTKSYFSNDSVLSFYYDDRYTEGYDEGYDEGYVEGLDEGLKNVFTNNNMLINSIKMGKNTTAPDNRFFGFKIVLPDPIYINNIDIIGLEKYHELLDLDVLSSSGNVPQGVVLTLGNTHSIHLAFQDFTSSKTYEMITSVKNNQEKLIDTIVIALAVVNPSMPSHEFERLQDDIYNNVGVYINNTVLSSEAMEHYFNKYYNEGYYEAKEEQKDLIEQAYNKGKNEGYNEGLNANPNNHWSDLLFTIFGAFGTILAIEILPGWSIGVIIGIPIVFGIIYFIIGRKKD